MGCLRLAHLLIAHKCMRGIQGVSIAVSSSCASKGGICCQCRAHSGADHWKALLKHNHSLTKRRNFAFPDYWPHINLKILNMKFESGLSTELFGVESRKQRGDVLLQYLERIYVQNSRCWDTGSFKKL